MARIEETCKACGKAYTTYWPESYQEFCSIGCRVDYHDSEMKENTK